MRSQVTRKMPFTEEQMQKIYNTNIIDFAREHGFEVEKGDNAPPSKRQLCSIRRVDG